jgi:hypothetical protein
VAHGFEGRAEDIAGSGFDLDDDELVAAAAHEVQLAAAGQEAGAYDFVATRFQQVGGGFFAGPA